MSTPVIKTRIATEEYRNNWDKIFRDKPRQIDYPPIHAHPRPYAYLAGPYSHPDPHVRHTRFLIACRIAGDLMLKGERVFSPIAHSHAVERWGMDKRQNGDFWLNQDFAFLAHASKMYILKLEGWKDSEGLAKEIEFCEEHDIPMEDIVL